MLPHPRYEPIELIGQGDFAVVYRARDRELGREVAIKQIHEQYLNDPAQLERYWAEAQLLASLEHPYICTVYDLVRDRGWLVMELMRGSVGKQLDGQPIDVDFLRVMLICVLHALRVLEEHGIVHGDVKPDNLLLDRAQHVKLSDFGIARRISGNDGSLLKGTTRYMAPEVVSDQFGPVGPHSDLYSLGFSAYALLCGSHFETLFPGLDMFGRDRQMAWIMWHAASDRRLPPIRRVLEGVPDDLVHVIEKLTEKDPARRYRTAEEAIADLRNLAQLPGAGPTPAEVQAEIEEQRKAKRKRGFAIGALAFSLVLSLGMLLPSDDAAPPAMLPEQAVIGGTVRQLDEELNQIVVEPEGGGKLARITVAPNVDRVLLNDQRIAFAGLQVGDKVVVEHLQTATGQRRVEVLASRVSHQVTGNLARTDVVRRIVEVIPQDGKEPVSLYVPTTAELYLNGERLPEQGLADIHKGDRVETASLPGENLPQVSVLRSTRAVTNEGFVVSVEADKSEKFLTVRLGIRTNSPLKKWPLAEDCRLTLNGAAELQGKPLTLTALRAGDRVRLTHDTHISRIDAFREVSFSGSIESVEPERRQLVVAGENGLEPVVFGVAQKCRITLAGGDQPYELSQLRPGDKVRIVHDSPDLKQAVAKAMEVEPQLNRRTWAVLLGQQQYDDSQLLQIAQSREDLKLLQTALRERYRVGSDQLLVKLDATRPELEQLIPQFLSKIPPDAQLMVYFVGHGFVFDDAGPTLAARDFMSHEHLKSGVPLRWLVEQLETCRAQEKLLLLDTRHPLAGELVTAQRSSSELIGALKPVANRAIAKSVIFVASCSPGERSLHFPDAQTGVFAHFVAAAWAGAADQNHDLQIDSRELGSYLAKEMGALELEGERQTPEQFLPNDTPARLTPKAREGVRRLLAHLRARQIDADKLNLQFEEAERLGPNEPDFKLAAGLVLLKHRKTGYATRVFEAVLIDHPDNALARRALAWQEFLKQNYPDALGHLEKAILGLPAARPGQPLSEDAQHVIQWAGRLQGFVKEVVPEKERPPTELATRLDEAVQSRGEQAQRLYEKGISETLEKLKILNEQQAMSEDAEQAKLRIQRKQVGHYANFDFDAAEVAVLKGLDD